MLIDHVIGGKYRITELIGQGGMGTVFEAVHTGTGSRVAIKLIVSTDIKEEVFVRFQREARAAGTIDSQHIVKVHDMGTDDRTGSPYMVMERLIGEDLSQLMRRVGPLDPRAALAITTQAALGLAKAHDAGVIHRDIKPANVFLHDGEGGEAVVKILDFGIAKVRVDIMQRAEEGGLTRTGSMLGSPHYMSPEQAQGLRTIDHRSDVWSLGVVLYKMLTGQTPHAHLQTLGQVILAICSTPTRPVQELAPWVQPEIAWVVHRALQPEPADRFQSAAEMARAIEPLLAGMPKLRRIDLLPLSSTQRARVEPAIAPFVQRDGPTNGTQHGMVQTPTELTPKKSAAVAVFIVAASLMALIGLTGIGVAVVAKKQAARAAAPIVAPTLVAPAPTTSSDPSPPGIALSSDRTVTVAITPPNAVVEVDGQKQTVVNGAIVLHGPLGAVQAVHVMANGTDVTQSVAITENGAIPAKVIASPASSSNAGRNGKVTGGGAKPGPTATGTGVNVQRTFE